MAKKRRIVLDRRSESEEPEDVPERYRDSGWSEWVRGSYAKWWYVILSMFVDIFVALEVSHHLSGSWALILPIFMIIVLVGVEIYLYHRLWGGLDFLFGDRRFL